MCRALYAALRTIPCSPISRSRASPEAVSGLTEKYVASIASQSLDNSRSSTR